MEKFKIYGDAISGNCLKVKWTADFLGLDYEWVDVGILAQETRTDAYLAINPFGQTPSVVFDSGKTLAQSNAIILFLNDLAGGSLLPSDAFARAKTFEWMFWEQNSHEPYIAGRRFRKAYLKLDDAAIDAEWLPRGFAALDRMELALKDSAFLVGDQLTAADIALVAYTRSADEGGFSLEKFNNIRAWIERVEKTLGIEPLGDA